ncbi:MAG: DUF4056 domain-containing protein [Sedimentisphaerales bacterium]|nr:DUF4056 domain-containing protein [Sedimentisphaerales bacterium]
MVLKLYCIISLLFLLFAVSGCGSSAAIFTATVHQRAGINFKTHSSGNWTFKGLDSSIPPRARSGYYSTTVSGTPFLDPDKLGTHAYCIKLSEKNGVVYTCKAGHIDIGHVRKMADWTGFLSAKTLEQIEKGNTEFKFKLYEPSIYYVKISYPENWDSYSDDERENIAKDVSIKLGKYFAFSAGTWHEILTWFGYRPKGLLPEFASAFSWEDMYSNLLGVLLAEKALQNDKQDFCSLIRLYLDEALQDLKVQSKKTTLLATEKVRGEWFSSKYFFTKIKKRNFDIGLDDGFITPFPVPGISGCEKTGIKLLEIPTLDGIEKYGFSVQIEVEPKEWEKNKILRVVYPQQESKAKKIDCTIHFPVLMDYIEKDAISRGYLKLADEHLSSR